MTYAPLLEHAHDKQGIGETELHQTLGGAAYPPIAEAQNDAGQPKHASPDESNAPVIASRVSDPLSDDHESLTFHPLPASKPTNPKDAIGVRKAPLSTVPMGVIVEMGVGMLEGTAKYGRHNYRCAGVRSSVYFDALMRHMIAWWEGEDTDPDSGLSHVTKALCTLAVLRDAQMQGMLTDDRPPSSAPFYPAMNKAAAGMIDKHADKSPRHYTIADTGLKL
jgi:hypothetical protein